MRQLMRIARRQGAYQLLEFLRPEIPFQNVDALKIQISKDVDATRECFAEMGHPR